MNELEKTLAKIYKSIFIRIIVILFFVFSGLLVLLNGSFDFLSKIRTQHNETNIIDTININKNDTLIVDKTKKLPVPKNNTTKRNHNLLAEKKYETEIKVSTSSYDSIDYSNNGFTIGEIYLTLFINKIPSKIEIFWNNEDKESFIVPNNNYKKKSYTYIFSIFHKYITIGEKNIKVEITYDKMHDPIIFFKKIEIKNLKL